jgi:cytochrome c551/c552
VLFAALLFPIGFAGWAVGHYTSLGKSTSVRTVTIGTTSAPPTTSTEATTTSGTTTSGGGGGGNAAAGKTVFASNNCASCHTFQPANASGTIGPNLDTRPEQDAKADHNMSLAAFVKESITDPDAYIAKGYTKGLMPRTFGSSLSKTQLNDLVAFIVSGKS